MKTRMSPCKAGARTMSAFVALTIGALAAPALAQMDDGPKTEKRYGIGLPRDHASQLFSDADYEKIVNGIV